MSNSWYNIWSRKASTHWSDNFTLVELMRLNGYDISVSAVNEKQIRDFALNLASKLRLKASDSVLEIGCGAGAMLKILKGMGLKVSGMDYTHDLIEIARLAIPEGTFSVGEAIAMEIPKTEKYDACFSHSVFHYFPSQDYACSVFSRMIDAVRPGGVVAVTDVHDAALKDEHIAWRRHSIGNEEYDRLYSTLSHSFFDKQAFISIAKQKCTSYWLEEQDLASASARFKFNFFAVK